MRPLLTISALLVSSQLLLACSSDDDGAGDPPVTVDEGGLPTDGELPGTGGGLASGSCLVPPDLEAGDFATYRYTDAVGATMDVSFDVASADDSAIVLDVTEGASVYRAAVPTFCNDTPELDLPGGEPGAAMQELFDAYASRPLLREIVQPAFGRFDDGTGQELDLRDTDVQDGDGQDDCVTSDAAVPALGAGPVATYACTFTYADAAGGTLAVDTTLAQTRRGFEDFGRLVEKVQTSTDGGVQSLVLMSFDGAG